jgi:HAD superfamily hydrolase (TIGR01509 family)
MRHIGPVQGVIFDFDGVIANSEPVHEAALREALDELGLHLSSSEFRARFVGMADEAILQHVLSQAGRESSRSVLDELHALKKHRMHERLDRGAVPIFAGVSELVRELSARVPLAIASAARRAEIHSMLARAELAPCFRAIVGLEDVQYTKPDPEPYQRAALALDLDPRACVAIEDTPTGLASARAAGCRTIAVCHSLPEDRLDADVVVQRISMLSVKDILLT